MVTLTSELDSEPQTWTWIHELMLSKSIAILTEWGGLSIHIKTKSNYQKILKSKGKILTSDLDSKPQHGHGYMSLYYPNL